MARLKPNDVKKILQVLEDGIHFMPELGKTEKMKIRSKIRRQYNWLLDLNNPTADMISHKLEEKLSDVLSKYPYGFSDNLKKLLKEKLVRFRSM